MTALQLSSHSKASFDTQTILAPPLLHMHLEGLPLTTAGLDVVLVVSPNH